MGNSGSFCSVGNDDHHDQDEEDCNIYRLATFIPCCREDADERHARESGIYPLMISPSSSHVSSASLLYDTSKHTRKGDYYEQQQTRITSASGQYEEGEEQEDDINSKPQRSGSVEIIESDYNENELNSRIYSTHDKDDDSENEDNRTRGSNNNNDNNNRKDTVNIVLGLEDSSSSSNNNNNNDDNNATAAALQRHSSLLRKTSLLKSPGTQSHKVVKFSTLEPVTVKIVNDNHQE